MADDLLKTRMIMAEFWKGKNNLTETVLSNGDILHSFNGVCYSFANILIFLMHDIPGKLLKYGTCAGTVRMYNQHIVIQLLPLLKARLSVDLYRGCFTMAACNWDRDVKCITTWCEN